MDEKICIVGLGYVGLPLAVEFGKLSDIIGFDIKEKRIQELGQNNDSTNEISPDELKRAKIAYTSDSKEIRKASFIIIAVPTPIDDYNNPDLGLLKSASKIVGENLSKNSVVVYESTVYPGCTEEVCAPILENYSGLKCGLDFKIGYSPERINPGDKEHTIDKIIKIVSGMDEDSLKRINDTYLKVCKAGVHKAPSIKVAEAAKVIENVQRDLNIALMNELSIIFNKLGIDTKDALEAASTKWNFHKYSPGLVGGHCIGVDPYYLTYKAESLGYHPEVILSGRRINDNMHKFIVELLVKASGSIKKVLIMGMTFKENVKDYRNSRVNNLIKELKEHKIDVTGCDPLLEKDIIEKEFGIKSYDFNEKIKFDAVILAVPHKQFKEISLKKLKDIMDNPILIDVKNFYKKEEAIKEGIAYRSL